MLQKDPKQRITAKEALNHQWFNTESKVGDNDLGNVRENMLNFNDEMKIEP